MKRIINFLRGWVEFTVAGVFPERLFNLCAQQEVAFWDLVRLDAHTVRLKVAAGDRKAFRRAAEQARCTVLGQRRGGVPFFAWRFRKRYAFLAGLVCALTAVVVLSRFILTVEVTGNETVPTAVITAQLRRQGVRFGAYGPGLDVRQIAQKVLLELDELSYLTINLHGTRAEVIVRERVEPPEIADETEYCDIYAEADGVVSKVQALAGEALVEPGDAVLEGEPLIAGMIELEPPLYSDLPSRYLTVRAEGSVYARTRRTLTAEIPLTAQVKTYTGETTTRYALLLPGRRINFYGNSGIPYEGYDKITERTALDVLPVTLVKEVSRAYTTAEQAVEQDAAEALLQEQLHERLLTLLGEDGTVLDERFSVGTDGAVLTVTLTAECEEEVGVEGPLTDRSAGQTTGETQ